MAPHRKPRRGGAARGARSHERDADSLVPLVREKEAELSARLLAAQREADERVESARREAASLLASAEDEARRVRELAEEIASLARAALSAADFDTLIERVKALGVIDERTARDLEAIRRESERELERLRKAAERNRDASIAAVMSAVLAEERGR